MNQVTSHHKFNGKIIKDENVLDARLNPIKIIDIMDEAGNIIQIDITTNKELK